MKRSAPASASRRGAQSGFTLVELLAALVLSSLVLVSLNLAATTVRQSVDKARQGLSSQAAVSAAAGIFARDAGRIAKIRRGEKESYLFEGSARQMIYPVREHQGASRAGLYLVRLRAIEVDGGVQLIRDRTPLIPRGTPEGKGWADAVMLLEGPFEIGFAYRAQRTGNRTWAESWSAAQAMPEQLRLTIADRATGRLRIPVLVQPLQIDAELECTAPAAACGAAMPAGGAQ